MISIVVEFDMGETGENLIGGIKKFAKGAGQAIGTGTEYAGKGLQKAGQLAQESGQILAKNPISTAAGVTGVGIGAYLLNKKRKRDF